MAKIANPQGKGRDLLTNHWIPVINLQKKTGQQIISDYVKSMLILSAEFGFKPVQEATYFLYLWKSTLRLSLIPFEKRPKGDIHPIAACELRDDLTWRVNFRSPDNLSEPVVIFLRDFSNNVENHLSQDKTLMDILPFYEAELPFYRRLYAAGLAKSLSLSLKQERLENKKAGVMASSLRLGADIF